MRTWDVNAVMSCGGETKVPLSTVTTAGSPPVAVHYTVYYTESAKSGLRFYWPPQRYVRICQYHQGLLELRG